MDYHTRTRINKILDLHYHYQLPLLTRKKSISRPKIKRKRKKFQINLETQKKSIILKPIEDPKNRTYSTGNNHTNNNRHKSSISNPSFPLESHQVSKNSGKKRCSGPNSLVKRHRQVPQRNIATNNRPTKHNTQSCNL